MIERLYRVRWVFDFAGKPSRRGMWSEPGDVSKGGAWSVSKDGLVHAAVERECLRTYKTEVVAECDGHDFVNFEWMAAASIPLHILTPDAPLDASVDVRGVVVGLRLVTRDLMLECTVDGGQRIVARPEAEKNIHLAGFGR